MYMYKYIYTYGLGLWEHTSLGGGDPALLHGWRGSQSAPMVGQVAHFEGAHKSLHDAAAGESLRSIHDKAASQRRQSTLCSSGHLGAQNNGNIFEQRSNESFGVTKRGCQVVSRRPRLSSETTRQLPGPPGSSPGIVLRS